MAAVLAAILNLVWWWSTPSVPSWRERITLSDLGAATAYRVEDLDDYKEPLRFSPDGKILADVPRVAPSAVRLWDASTGTLRAVLRPELAEIPILEWLAFSPDGKILVAGGSRSPRSRQADPPALHAYYGATAWDVAMGRRLATLRFPLRSRETPEERLASYRSGELEVLSPAEMEEQDADQLEELGTDSLRPAVTFSPDGKTVLIAADGTLTAWEPATWNRRLILDPHHGRGDPGLCSDVRSEAVHAVSPDAGLFATLNLAGRRVTLREVKTGQIRSRLPPRDVAPRSPQFSPDGRHPAVPELSAAVSGFDLVFLPPEVVRRRQRAAQGRTPLVRLWTLGTGVVCDLPAAAIGSVRFTTDGKTLVMFGKKDGRYRINGFEDFDPSHDFDHVRLFDLASGKTEVLPISGATGDARMMPGSRTLGVTTWSSPNSWTRYLPNRVQSWLESRLGLEEGSAEAATVFVGLDTGRPRSILNHFDIGADPSAISPDGKVIAVSGSRGTVTLFDAPP